MVMKKVLLLLLVISAVCGHQVKIERKKHTTHYGYEAANYRLKGKAGMHSYYSIIIRSYLNYLLKAHLFQWEEEC